MAIDFNSHTKSLLIAAALLVTLFLVTRPLSAGDPNFNTIAGDERPWVAALHVGNGPDFGAICNPLAPNPQYAAKGNELNFGVMIEDPLEHAVAATSPAKPKILIYSMSLESCRGCRRLLGEWQSLSADARAKYPFEIDIKKEDESPNWVTGFPTAHWSDEAGTDHQYAWPGGHQQKEGMLSELRRTWEQVDQLARRQPKAQRKHRDDVVGRFKPKHRGLARQAYDIASQKLQSDPNISPENLRTYVRSQMTVPPFLFAILEQIIWQVVQALIDHFRPTPAAAYAVYSSTQLPG